MERVSWHCDMHVPGHENLVDPDALWGRLAVDGARDGRFDAQGFVDDGVEVREGFYGVVGPGAVAVGEDGVEEGLQTGVDLGVED